MSSLQLLRSLWMFFYDTFIGKEVTFREAVRKHRGKLFLILLLCLSLFINVLTFKQIADVRNIARSNKVAYKDLEKKHADMEEQFKSQYTKILFAYSYLYYEHYDRQGNLIIHDARTGKSLGVLTDNEMKGNGATDNPYHPTPPYEYTKYITDGKTMLPGRDIMPPTEEDGRSPEAYEDKASEPITK